MHVLSLHITVEAICSKGLQAAFLSNYTKLQAGGNASNYY
jgi:hypothetical protein